VQAVHGYAQQTRRATSFSLIRHCSSPLVHPPPAEKQQMYDQNQEWVKVD